jgi:hypothetical protein
MLATAPNTEQKHTRETGVVSYIVNPNVYYKKSVFDLSNITFETAVWSETDYDGTKLKKPIRVIYPILKESPYQNSRQILKPLEYFVKGELRRNCVYCYKQVPKCKNKDWEGKPACKKCHFDNSYFGVNKSITPIGLN